MDTSERDKVLSFDDFAGQAAVTQGLLPAIRSERQPHACLISGPRGVGKRTLAKLTAAALLCSGEMSSRPCGVCGSCHRVMEGMHPDLTRVTPGRRVDPHSSSTSQSVVVDDIRAINAIVADSAYEGHGRVVVIEDAAKMLPQAQNALLKTLEEPPEHTCFILVTEDASALLPTVISRCRAVQIHPWDDAYVLKQLTERGIDSQRAAEASAAAEGSIGKALSLAGDEAYWKQRDDILRDFFGGVSAGDIPAISAKWKEGKQTSDTLLDILSETVRTMLLVRLGLRDASAVQSLAEGWQRMARDGQLRSFAALQDSINEARKMRSSQVTWQAIVEKVLFRMTEEYRRWQR